MEPGKPGGGHGRVKGQHESRRLKTIPKENVQVEKYVIVTVPGKTDHFVIISDLEIVLRFTHWCFPIRDSVYRSKVTCM